jgi:hypothetical protein
MEYGGCPPDISIVADSPGDRATLVLSAVIGSGGGSVPLSMQLCKNETQQAAVTTAPIARTMLIGIPLKEQTVKFVALRLPPHGKGRPMP